MSKKALASLTLACMLVVSLLVGGATLALFTDTATNANNDFTAGTINLQADRNHGDYIPGPMFYPNSLDPDGRHAYDTVQNNPSGEALGGWAPGDKVDRRMILRNTGTLDALVKGIKATPRESYTQNLRPANQGGTGGTRTVNGLISGDAYEEFIEKAHVRVTNSDNNIVLYDGQLEDLIFADENAYANVVEVLEVQASGLLNITFEVTLDVSASNELQNKTFIFDFGFYAEQKRNNTGGATGTISGVVTNALDGNGVNGLTMNFRSSHGTQTGAVVGSTSTGSNGAYSIVLPEGNYTGEVSGAGYITTYFNVVSVGNVETPNQNTSVSPDLNTGETRIVLTWNQNPRDLDSHLTGPAEPGSSNRFHIHFGNRTYTYDGLIRASLDRDVVNGYGPETITISNQMDGMYRYTVYNWSNEETLANSGANVQVYRNNQLVASFDVPNQQGRYWTVFELTEDTITPINTISSIGTFSTQSSSIQSNSAQYDEELIYNVMLSNSK